MENIILDIETDGLLDSVTKVHCLVMKIEPTKHMSYVEVATTETEDFQELSQEMIDYCKNDVELTDILWKNLRAKLPSEKSIRLEHNIADICFEQEKTGFPFDEENAIKLYSKLSKRRDELAEELRDVFGSWLINEGLRRNELYTKVKIIEFNPNSRQHIAKRLKELRGWKPVEFTPTGEP